MLSDLIKKIELIPKRRNTQLLVYLTTGGIATITDVDSLYILTNFLVFGS